MNQSRHASTESASLLIAGQPSQSDRVLALREKIESGAYRVDPMTLAERMLDCPEARDHLGLPPRRVRES